MDAAAPCATNPDGWDLDHGDLPDWLGAIRTCTTECPLLHACTTYRRTLYPGAEGPAGVVWAGIAYSPTGKRLTPPALAEYASAGNTSRRRAA